jgi:hypothetical protein
MLKPKTKTLALTASIAVCASNLLAAEPESPSVSTPVPTDTTAQMGTASGWMFQASGDYFHYDLKWDFGPGYYNYKETGDQYGGTVYLKFPFMQVDDWVELSYHHGRFTGNGTRPDGHAYTDVVDTDQAILQYRRGIWKDRPQDPMFKLDLLAGVSWDTDNNSYGVPANGNSTDHMRDNTYLFNAGLSVSWYAWTKRSEDASKRFRVGLRAEGLGEVGATLEDETISGTGFATVANEYKPWLTWGVDGKGLVFADYKMGNVSFVLEGGWQFRELWYDYTRNSGGPSYSSTESRQAYGPYVRAGIGIAL